MANTECMSDEFIESLATAGSSSAVVSTSSSSSSSSSSQDRRRQQEQRQRQQLRSRQMQNRLQKKMELPIGDSPAAKVVRASPNNQYTNSRAPAENIQESDGVVDPPSQPSPTHEDSTGARPLVGNIIEHNDNHRGNKKKVNGKGSRFSRNRQETNNTTTKTHSTGFPSVHDKPFGTFVKGKKKDGNRPINKTVMTSIDKRSNGTNNKNNVIDMNSSGRSDSNAHHLLQEASHNEAQSMLTGMSLEEIKDNQQEIRQALSPELMAFLKDRRKSKVQQKETASGRESSSLPSSSSTNNTIRTESTTATSTPDMSTSNKNKKSQEENLERDDKERMAKLVASIKTHEDLDATFRAEMKSDVFGIDFDENDGDDDKNGKEQFLVACGLLRSTSPRQTLWAARTVSFKLNELITAPTFKLQQQLQQQQDNDNVKNDRTDPPATSVAETSTITKADLPSTLPVSLRCLLDKLLTSSCNYLLHTYALQSLYYLTIIYAHPDHDVIHYDSSSPLSLESGATTHTTSEKFTCSDVSIFQEDFMDDAVPTPPLDTAYPPMSVTPLAVPEEISRNNTNDKNGAPAYMTSSSTASALTEGEAFKKDPMWTLLSKMKILPRLSFLLEHQQHMTSIPAEALVAICGIVSMVGQRSPGAASAIVQHKTLTSQLLKRMIEQIQQGRSESGENSNNNNGRIIHATMRLFCILSRQSRVAAEGLPLEEILAPLLAVGPASSYEEFRTQQQALVLWRTMLRYGLGLEALPFMLTVSARHLALPYTNEFSLSSEFLSAFTLVLECVKVVWSKNHGASTAATATTTETLSTVHEDPTGMINPASIKIIETATKLMVSTLILSKKNSPFDTDTDLILKYRFNASRLLYLSTWFQLFDPAVNTYDDVAVEDYISLDDQETLLLTMQSWAEREGVIETAWKSVALWCDPSLNPEKLSRNITSIKVEAAASGFIHGYFSVALVLLRSKVSNSRIEDIKLSLHKILVRTIIEGLKSALNSQADHVTSAEPKYNNSAREGWIIQSHFAVAKFCFHSMSMGLIESSSDLTLVRSMVFSLLGRLQKGNESIAAVLYSSDALFQTCGNPVQEDTMSTESSSPISTMFLGEVCGSERARKQLDHSFKLQHGFGLTSAGFGPFALDSLLGNAEQPNTGPTGPNSTEDSTFPLGKFWIWQCLSGSIRMRDDVVAVGAEEATNVIAAVLGLILEQDETEEVMGIAGYMSRLPMGSKIYYLINICLQPEQVFRDERIFNCGEVILDRYLKHFGDDEIDIAEFCQECLDHSGRDSKISKITNDEEEDALQEKDKKLLDDFANAMEGDYNKDSQISHEEYRALEAFVEDLATAYREYGAQYDFFTKCIRIFLLPVFPSSIRCRALKELENMLHLLTVSKEYEDEDEMALLLSKSFVGGIPNIDNSIRDGAEILDAASRILARDSISPRPLDGYMRHYCIGLLVRSFASSLSTEQGIETSKLRMKRLNKKNVHTICKATSHLMQTDGSRSALVAAVIESSSSSYTNNNDEMTEKDYVEKCINNCINRHISSKSSDNR